MQEEQVSVAEDKPQPSVELESSESLNQAEVLKEEQEYLFEGTGDCPSKDDDFNDIKDESEFVEYCHRKPPQAALCLSGGGIRSATFSLGVLQGLAKLNLLKDFHFLSTVSGGGFIGSWLSRCLYEAEAAQKTKGGSSTTPIEQVSQHLAQEGSEHDSITRLRAYSSYLSPKTGFSHDSATLVAIVLRNLLLTWLVLLPFLLAVLMVPMFAMAIFKFSPVGFELGPRVVVLVLVFALLLLMLFLTFSRSMSQGLGLFLLACLLSAFISPFDQEWPLFQQLINSGKYKVNYVELALFTTLAPVVVLLGYFIIQCFFQGCFSLFLNEKKRERSARNSAAVLMLAAGWLILSSTVLLLPNFLFDLLKLAPARIAAAGGLLGLITILIGFFGRHDINRPSAASGILLGWVQRKILPIASGFLLLLLTVGLSLVIASAVKPTQQLFLDKERVEALDKKRIKTTEVDKDLMSRLFWKPDEAAKIALAQRNSKKQPAKPASTIRWERRLFNLDKNYRHAVLDAHLGIVSVMILLFFVASVVFSWVLGVNRFSLHALYGNRLVRAYLASSRENSERQPDTETGFDPKDNLPIASLKLTESHSSSRLLHIINSTLNLSGSNNPKWQKRKGSAFTFSCLHSGSKQTDFVHSKGYASDKSDGVSLGKAMTISGAAVSPAMGYHSSKLVGAMLTLLNLRLGWWLPNPQKSNKKNWTKNEPAKGFWSLLYEFFGRTHERSSFVYLSDGGHFENLGLYEMVRRRCRYIVVVDAGQDADHEYESLSNALRMIRIDFGVDITFDAEKGPGRGRKLEQHFAIGRIAYKQADDDVTHDVKDGVLIYIKPVLLGDEFIDVLHYAQKRAKFPQETTADQFFDEAQFESYRQLGLTSVEALGERYSKPSQLQDISVPEFMATSASLDSQVRPQVVKSSAVKEANKMTLEKASMMSSMMNQVSSVAAPLAATTVAAATASVVAVNLNAPESIKLEASDIQLAISKDTPKVQLTPSPKPIDLNISGCDKNLIADDNGVVNCGAFSLRIPQLAPLSAVLSRLDRRVLTSETRHNLLSDYIYQYTWFAPESSPRSWGEISLNDGDRQVIKEASNEGEFGMKLQKTHFDSLQQALSSTAGLRVNQSDISNLREIVDDMQKTSIPNSLNDISSKLGIINTQITEGFSGLRNDSGGLE